MDAIDPENAGPIEETPAPDTAVPEPAVAPPDAVPAPEEEETSEQFMRRLVEENSWRMKPRPPRPVPPPEPKSIPLMTPEEMHDSLPVHLRRRRPDGSYYAMSLISRMQTDLAELTQGKRAATYPEVDEYLGYALLAEGLAPRGYTAEEATRWWKAGGSQVLGEAPSPGGDSGHGDVLPEPRPEPAVFMRPVPSAFGDAAGPTWGSSSVDIGQEMRSQAAAVKISQNGKKLQGAAQKAPPRGILTLRNGVKYQDWGGDVNEAQKILERYPMLIKQFAGSTIKIAIVPDNVTQYPLTNPGGHPRNWPKGATYKDVPALYYEDGDTVIIASKQVKGQSTEYRLLHELGHALDYMKTSRRGFKASREDEFKAAYKADLPTLKKIDAVDYFDNNTAAGWSETYASSFARMKTDRARLKRELPNIYAYWARKSW